VTQGTTSTEATPGAEPWRRNLRGDETLGVPRGADWWTGLPPVLGACPGVDADGVLHGLPIPDWRRATRDDVLAYFENGWTITETLFAGLVGEEAFVRPPWHDLRHPMIFYYAHPAALFVNKLRVAGALDGAVHAEFEQLFETGVDEMSWDDLSKNAALWPAVSEARGYRRTVHDLVAGVIREHPDFAALPVEADQAPSAVVRAVLMGCEHERIHIETSSVLIRELPAHLVERHPAWPAPHPSAAGERPLEPPADAVPALRLVDLPSGDATIGKSRDWPTFGWDNEYGRRVVHVGAFGAAERLISNAEMHAFVTDGGYREARWWTDDGWQWRTFRNVKWPTWWVPAGPAGLHQYRLRTVFDVVDMPWDWPVAVNAHEARAYAAWRSEQDGCTYRLPTEAEHHRMRATDVRSTADDAASAVCGGRMPSEAHANLSLAFGSESPVTAMPPNASGVRDVFGNVWQWCEDHFAALPGFEVDPLYDDFSAPCFDGEHHIIMGGSFASIGDEASAFARFHFRSHFYQHAGIRLVRPADPEAFVETTCCDAPPPHVGAGPCCTREGGRGVGKSGGYESSGVRDAYLLMHYGTPEETFGALPGPADAVGFPVRVAATARDWADRAGAGTGRALDVGCAVGGSSFDLTRRFGEVIGIDLSASFVDTAAELAARGELPYLRVDEGAVTTPLVARLPDGLDPSRTTFRRGDACALPADLGSFDLVLLANLLCRLPSPRACLGRLGGPRGLVRPGGVLVVTTPATWREQFTPHGAWLGGYERDGQPVKTIDGLGEALGDEFERLHREDVPFVIREHGRKFEFVFAELSVWRRSSETPPPPARRG
jgi:5-histidylcysteine sulfoxide synthase/putative 4-mercaptohistidine N1-methyltranferase